MEFKLVLDAGVFIAETPIWDSRINKLYWTDLATGDVHRFDPETKSDEIWPTHQPIGGIGLCNKEDKLLCAVEAGMFLLDLNTGMLDFILNPEKRMGYKFNDTRIDPKGRIFTSSVTKYFGTPKHTPDMLGAFYMIDTDMSVKTLVEGIVQYNGMVWNSGATKMYVIDTENQKLMYFDYDIEKGPASEVKTALDLSEYGMPDGMSIDEDDNLYICHWTKKLTIWDKNLKLKEIVDFPVDYLCCTGFGGKDMKTLFAATSTYQYTAEDLEKNKGAGGIFAAAADIKGKGDNYYIIQD